MPGASKSSAPDFTGARGPWPTCHWLATVQRCVEPPLSVWGLYHFWSSSVGGPRAWYVFHYDEVAEAEAQGLPYVLVPRQLSREEWEKKYCHAPAAEEKKD
jgi:hypothetical protein